MSFSTFKIETHPVSGTLGIVEHRTLSSEPVQMRIFIPIDFYNEPDHRFGVAQVGDYLREVHGHVGARTFYFRDGSPRYYTVYGNSEAAEVLGEEPIRKPRCGPYRVRWNTYDGYWEKYVRDAWVPVED